MRASKPRQRNEKQKKKEKRKNEKRAGERKKERKKREKRKKKKGEGGKTIRISKENNGIRRRRGGRFVDRKGQNELSRGRR